MARSFSKRDCNVIARALWIGVLMLAALSGVSAQSAGPRVELNLIVTDKDNKSVNTIKKEDINAFEDKAEQTVVTLEADERPVDCILAIDASGSFRSFLGAALQATQLLDRKSTPLNSSH